MDIVPAIGGILGIETERWYQIVEKKLSPFLISD